MSTSIQRSCTARGARGIRRIADSAVRSRGPSAALRLRLAEVDRRLAAAADPLAHLTRERFVANQRDTRPDTLGVGPRLAPRR